MIDGMSPLLPSQQAAAGPTQAGQEKELKDACQQFEEMFLTQMLKQMRKTAPKGEMFGGGGQGEEQFSEMLDQERAKSWSQEGGIGLATMMFEQTKKNM